MHDLPMKSMLKHAAVRIRALPRSAGFQPAVSQPSSLQTSRYAACPQPNSLFQKPRFCCVAGVLSSISYGISAAIMSESIIQEASVATIEDPMVLQLAVQSIYD
jgi:hypothetical protein